MVPQTRARLSKLPEEGRVAFVLGWHANAQNTACGLRAKAGDGQGPGKLPDEGQVASVRGWREFRGPINTPFAMTVQGRTRATQPLTLQEANA